MENLQCQQAAGKLGPEADAVYTGPRLVDGLDQVALLGHTKLQVCSDVSQVSFGEIRMARATMTSEIT